jgi:putative hydrolase of the HAD superfamily
LNKLKGKYKLGLITNTDYLGYKSLQEKFEVDGLFDLSLKSYELKMSKPNPKVYEKMLKGLSVKPEEALMVGDSYEDDFEASMLQGMNALLIDRRERYQDVDKRITSLSELLDNI